LCNKTTELHELLYNNDFNIIAVTESWLSSNISNGLLDPQGAFHVLRRDRTGTSGGGVCAFVNSKLSSKPVDLVDASGLTEVLCFDLFLDYVIRIFVVYRPTASSSIYGSDIFCAKKYLSDTLDIIRNNINPIGPTVIMGDFNLPEINWSDLTSPSYVGQLVCDFCMQHSFVQCVQESTRNNSLLDVILTNDESVFSSISVEAPFSTSDHNLINFSLQSFSTTATGDDSGTAEVLQWNNADYDAMNEFLSTVDWHGIVMTNLTADDLWSAFCQVLQQAIRIFVPSAVTHLDNGGVKRPKQRYPRHINKLLSQKRSTWRLLKNNQECVEISDHYKNLTKNCRMAIREYEIEREMKIINAKNQGTFFKFINKRLACKGSIGLLRDSSGNLVHTDIGKAELLNSFFSDTATKNYCEPSQSTLQRDISASLDDVKFSSSEIYKCLKKCKPKKSCDLDGFNSFLLKQLAPSMSYPISLLFNSLMSTGSLPTAWKKTVISPIFKKGSSSDPANYRPVSISSTFCKLMERVIVTHMLLHLERHNLLSKEQHGFLQKRSTLTNLTETMNDWTLSLENKTTQTAVYIDFKRAFDMVPHDKLLYKLRVYGFGGNLLLWIGNFLKNRTQATKVGSSISSFKSISSGVIQGSCLGPLLFVIYINDITDIIPQPVRHKLYADDLKLYMSVNNSDDLSVYQNTLDEVANWSRTWELPISLSKCCKLDIGHTPVDTDELKLEDAALDSVQVVRDLGILNDQHLSFEAHINEIVKKAYTRGNMILRCFESRNRRCLVKAFTVYVRPVLEFNSPIWSPYLIKLINRIENVQRSFTKRLPGLKHLTYAQRLTVTKLESLELRRLKADLTTMYRIVFNMLTIDISNIFKRTCINFNLRRHAFQLSGSRCYSRIREHFFINRTINVWNSLPVSTDFTNCDAFIDSIDNVFLCRFLKVNFN